MAFLENGLVLDSQARFVNGAEAPRLVAWRTTFFRLRNRILPPRDMMYQRHELKIVISID